MILYFSGTRGNFKICGPAHGGRLWNQSLLSMNDRIRSTRIPSPWSTDERLVIVTPTYAWRIPVGAGLAAGDGVPGAAQVWFISDLRQRDRPAGITAPLSDQGPDGHGDSLDHHAGELHCHV